MAVATTRAPFRPIEREVLDYGIVREVLGDPEYAVLAAFDSGGCAPLRFTPAAFAIWGLREARTRTQRTIGLVLTIVCVSSTVMDYVIAMTTRY